jgi:hypothetical protein
LPNNRSINRYNQGNCNVYIFELKLHLTPLEQMIYRLKTRLALANFKRLYGYERYDLHTLETNLILKTKNHKKQLKKKPTQSNRHRYYPTSTTTSTQYQPNLLLSPTQALRYPLSEKRSTSPQQPYKKIPTDEDAANLLVMLHTSKPSSSPPLCS